MRAVEFLSLEEMRDLFPSVLVPDLLDVFRAGALSSKPFQCWGCRMPRGSGGLSPWP